jgi:hypothetical protein
VGSNPTVTNLFVFFFKILSPAREKLERTGKSKERAGFEPATTRSAGECSTTELTLLSWTTSPKQLYRLARNTKKKKIIK